MNKALAEAGDVFEALGSAQMRAAEAMRDGRVIYTNRLGFAQQNMLECWLFYCTCTCIGGSALVGARKQLRSVIGWYRQLHDQERVGIAGRLK